MNLFTQILVMSLLVAFYVQKTVTIPEFYVSRFTMWNFYRLTVLHKQYSRQVVRLIFTRQPRFTLWSRLTTRSLENKVIMMSHLRKMHLAS
jgi:hypothetical protein